MSYITGDFPVSADGRNVGSVHIAQNGSLLVFDCACTYHSQDIVRLAAVCKGTYVPLGVMAPEAGLLRLKKGYTKNALASIGYDDSRYPEAVSFYLIRSGDIFSATELMESAPVPQIEDDSETPAEPTAPDNASEAILSAYAPEPIVYNDFPEPTDYYFEPEAEDNTDDTEPATTAQEPVPEPVLQQADIQPTHTQAEQRAAYSDGTPAALNGWLPTPNPGSLFDDAGVQEACTDIQNALIKEQEDCVLLAVPVSQTEPFPMMPVFCFGSSERIGEQDCIIFKIRNGNLTL